MRARNIFMGCLSLAFASACAAGIETSSPEQRAKLQTEYMRDHLALDAGTLAKVNVINLKYARQLEPIIKGDDNRLSKMSKSKPIMAAKDQEMKAVLAPDQYSQYMDQKDAIKDYLESHL